HALFQCIVSPILNQASSESRNIYNLTALHSRLMGTNSNAGPIRSHDVIRY
ncbi:50S ribosomal protein L33, partial [Dysosmobacter welbionis]